MTEESEQLMEQIQGLHEEEERLHKTNKKNFIICNVCIVLFSSINCLSIYCIAIDFNKENFIPVLMSCLVFMAMSIYYAISYGRRYYRKRDGEIARKARCRERISLSPQNEEFEEESDSRSSPVDSSDPAADGPSNLPQTESSTLSEQTSTESSERTSLLDITKGTFTTNAVIEHIAVAKTSGDIHTVAEEKIASKDQVSKPFTSSLPDLTIGAESENDTGKVRHRRLTPE